MRNPPLTPLGEHQIAPDRRLQLGAVVAAFRCPPAQQPRAPFQTLAKFDSEFRCGLGYHQPAGAFASVGVMGAGTGATQSKYVARRETPVYIAENCTQCMECITACPDTALPNTAQDVATVLKTAVINYVTDTAERKKLLRRACRASKSAPARKMNESVKAKTKLPFKDIIRDEVTALADDFRTGEGRVHQHHRQAAAGLQQRPRHLPLARERRRPARADCSPSSSRDLCKGCGECVQVCGDHDALRMTRETEELNAELTTAQIFSRLLPDTPQKFLGLYNDGDAAELPRGRACAITSWCAAITKRSSPATAPAPAAARRASCAPRPSVTEAYMRPLYHKKADRLRAKADAARRTKGAAKLAALKARSETEYQLFRKAFAHVIMGLGGENDEDTAKRIADYEAKHGADHRRADRSADSSPCCDRTPSITRNCRPSMAAAPTACP